MTVDHATKVHRRKTILGTVLVGAILTGLVAWNDRPKRPSAQYEPGFMLKRNVESAVNEKLIDPTTSIFRDLRARTRASGAVTVCGYVNGKNRLGAYVGDQPFLITFYRGGTLAGDVFIGDDEVVSMCETDGIRLPS